ncbi:ABC transporter ATP-binding protein [Candidatus Woesearchaeota archaeon]|nr:ABC transporter ATP-binding protein [Candidatus Woesearchaeota archaeon]
MCKENALLSLLGRGDGTNSFIVNTSFKKKFLAEKNMPSKLVVEEVTTGYTHFKIQRISFTLEAGDIYGLLGRSGSGKSTIIKALLGILSTQNGRINFSNGNGGGLTVGYSPQYNALYPFLTLEENLHTFAKLHGVRNNDLHDRSKKLLTRLGLAGHEQKRIQKFSGGMGKRADLAVTLIHDPDVIVLDEPFTGLDVSLQQFIWKLLRELAAEGKIIIITSHLLEDLQKNCTDYGLVENGWYYGDEEIRKAINRNQGTLQTFLEGLFARDFKLEKENQQEQKPQTNISAKPARGTMPPEDVPKKRTVLVGRKR